MSVVSNHFFWEWLGMISFLFVDYEKQELKKVVFTIFALGSWIVQLYVFTFFSLSLHTKLHCYDIISEKSKHILLVQSTSHILCKFLMQSFLLNVSMAYISKNVFKYFYSFWKSENWGIFGRKTLIDLLNGTLLKTENTKPGNSLYTGGYGTICSVVNQLWNELLVQWKQNLYNDKIVKGPQLVDNCTFGTIAFPCIKSSLTKPMKENSASKYLKLRNILPKMGVKLEPGGNGAFINDVTQFRLKIDLPLVTPKWEFY